MCQEVRLGKFVHPNLLRLTESSAYTIYAFFEWALVLLDVAFDAVTALDFSSFELIVKDVKGLSRGYVPWLPK